MIAVFPLKTGDSMFVGFDSQNTSHSFPHYPNWNLWFTGISLIGFRGGSENKSWRQPCNLCRYMCDLPGVLGLIVIDELPAMIGWDEVAGRFRGHGNSIFNLYARVLPRGGIEFIETLEERINFRV